MVDLNKLAAEIHEAAVNKGFWSVEDAEEKHLAKMISELGEVVQADRAGIMYEVEREGAKPEGVVAELADFVMMALDLAVQKYSIHLLCNAFAKEAQHLPFYAKERKDCNTPEDLIALYAEVPVYRFVASNAANIHLMVAFVKRDDVYFESMGSFIHFLSLWCTGNGFDLFDVIRQKMAYNESRPALHGRKY